MVYDETDNDVTEGAGTPESIPNLTKEGETELLVSEINKFLSAPPRFEGELCVVLTMPESYLRKARAKLNEAIHVIYDRYHPYGVSMLTILCAIETVVDANKLSPLIDNDIKLIVAAERGIEVSPEYLDMVAERVKNGDTDFCTQKPAVEEEVSEGEEQDEDAAFNKLMDIIDDEDDDE